MASIPRLILLILVVFAVVVLSSTEEVESELVREKRNPPDAVEGLLNNVNENLKDILQRLGNLLSGSNSLPPTVVEVIKDVIKILGRVIEALGGIVGIHPPQFPSHKPFLSVKTI